MGYIPDRLGPAAMTTRPCDTPGTLELVLFENEAEEARMHQQNGISTFMIDWEVLGKASRQHGFDTEIRPGTAADLKNIAAVPGTHAWCRINPYGPHTAQEVETAASLGARVILLPMATTLHEVDAFVDLVGGRCKSGILIETVQAQALAPRLHALPIDYAYFGLNDFAISRGDRCIFNALVDGSVEATRNALPDVRFGVGGLTAIERGHPIPAARLLEEMSRLGCDFTFLRRSFRRDAMETPAAAIVEGIHRYWRQCAQRGPEERMRGHRALADSVQEVATLLSSSTPP